MIPFVDLYRALIRIGILGQIQYRASGAIWMIGAILEPVIFLVVWSTVARSNGGSVGGFDASQFAAYYLILMLVNHLTFSWIMQVFQFRVQQGALSAELLRPVHPIHADLADNVSYKFVMMVVLLPSLLVLMVLFEPRFEFDTPVIVFFLPALVLAFLTRFFLEWTLALAAFWTTRVTAINQAYFSIAMFLSGRVAPMALMPLWLQDVAHVLPFYYTIAFPVELAMGTLSVADAWRGIAMQLLWLVIAIAIIVSVWRAAVKRYSAVGS